MVMAWTTFIALITIHIMESSYLRGEAYTPPSPHDTHGYVYVDSHKSVTDTHTHTYTHTNKVPYSSLGPDL